MVEKLAHQQEHRDRHQREAGHRAEAVVDHLHDAEAKQEQRGPVPLHSRSYSDCPLRLPRKSSRRATKRRNSMPIMANDSGMKPTTIQRGMSSERTSFSFCRKSLIVTSKPYQARIAQTAMQTPPMT